MTDLNILRPRADVPLSGAGNPTVTTVARLNEFYQNETTGELFTCVSIDNFGWGNTYKWAGSQNTIIDNDILSDSNANLVAMYTMDNISGSTLVDESPNANNTTIDGAVAVTGKIGNALDFDGVDDNCRLTGGYSSTDINELGFGGWVYLDSFPISVGAERVISTHRARFAGAGNTDNSGCFLEFTDFFTPGDIRLWCGHVMLNNESITDSNGNNRNSYTCAPLGSTTMSTGQWVHVWYNLSNGGKTSTIYLNGVEETTATSVQTVRYSGQGATNGEILAAVRTTTTLVNFADIKIDQFRFFNRTLTQAEVTALYNEGAIV